MNRGRLGQELRKTAILDVWSENKTELKIKDICAMVDVSPSSVEDWLYHKSRAPELGDLYSIYRCLKSAKLNIPESLKKIWSSHLGNARIWMLETGRIEGPGKKYLYKEELLTLKKISEKSGRKNSTVVFRVKQSGKQPGEDVTSIVDRERHELVRKNMWLYQGVEMDTKAISVASGRSLQQCYLVLKYSGKKPGDDVTEVIENTRIKKRRKP